MTAIINLVLRRREKPTRTGYVYEVLKDGKVLLASVNPEFAACRLLASEGVIGKVRFWREGRMEHNSEFDIQRAANFTVRENEQSGPRFVKFKPLQSSGEATIFPSGSAAYESLRLRRNPATIRHPALRA